MARENGLNPQIVFKWKNDFLVDENGGLNFPKNGGGNFLTP
jgi:hypothetical protein